MLQAHIGPATPIAETTNGDPHLFTEIWTLVWNIGSLAFAMTCNSPIHQRLGSQALLLLRCQGLSYVEFFAGEGEVFRAIRADHHPGAAVDIEYMVGSGHAMDINSDSGLPFHPLQLYSQSYFSKCIVQWVINKMMFDFEPSVLHEHVEFHLAFYNIYIYNKVWIIFAQWRCP